MGNIHGVEKTRPIFRNRKKTNSFFVLVVDASTKQSFTHKPLCLIVDCEENIVEHKCRHAHVNALRYINSSASVQTNLHPAGCYHHLSILDVSEL